MTASLYQVGSPVTRPLPAGALCARWTGYDSRFAELAGFRTSWHACGPGDTNQARSGGTVDPLRPNDSLRRSSGPAQPVSWVAQPEEVRGADFRIEQHPVARAAPGVDRAVKQVARLERPVGRQSKGLEVELERAGTRRVIVQVDHGEDHVNPICGTLRVGQ